MPDLPPTTGERRRRQPGLHGLTTRRLRGLRAAGHPPPRFSRPAGAWGSGRRPAARTGPRPDKGNTDGRTPERPHAQATHRRAAGRAPRSRPRARPPGSRAAAQLRRMAPVVDHSRPIHLLQPDESAPGRPSHARRDPGGRIQGVAEPRVLRTPRGKGRHPDLDATPAVQEAAPRLARRGQRSPRQASHPLQARPGLGQVAGRAAPAPGRTRSARPADPRHRRRRARQPNPRADPARRTARLDRRVRGGAGRRARLRTSPPAAGSSSSTRSRATSRSRPSATSWPTRSSAPTGTTTTPSSTTREKS